MKATVSFEVENPTSDTTYVKSNEFWISIDFKLPDGSSVGKDWNIHLKRPRPIVGDLLPEKIGERSGIISIVKGSMTHLEADVQATGAMLETKYRAILTVGWAKNGAPIDLDDLGWQQEKEFTFLKSTSQPPKDISSMEKEIVALDHMYKPLTDYSRWSWDLQARFASNLLLHPTKAGLDRLKTIAGEVASIKLQAAALRIDVSKLQEMGLQLAKYVDLHEGHIKFDVVKACLNSLIPERDIDKFLGKEIEFFFELDKTHTWDFIREGFTVRVEGTKYKIVKINAESAFAPEAVLQFNKNVMAMVMAIYNYLAQVKYVVEGCKTAGAKAA